MPSSAALTVILPLSISTVAPALMPSLTVAAIDRVSSRIFSHASPSSSVVSPDLMPFLPFASILSVPLPHSVTCEPSLHLMTAFSAASFSGCVSSLFCSVSAKVFTVPSAATIVTAVLLLQAIGAVVLPVSVRPSSTSVTPVVPFLTVTLPSAHVPDRT